MRFEQLVRQDCRLRTLQILANTPGYGLNARIIKTALGQLNHTPSTDLLNNDLNWLEEQGLVTLTEVSGLKVATLTERGADVAAGRSKIDGIAAPGPGE